MRIRRLFLLGLFALVGAAASCSYVALPGGLIVNFPLAGEPLSQEEVGTLRVPRGFSVTSYADGIPNARMLRFTRSGDLLVTAPREGKIVLLEKDRDGDGRSDGQRVLLSELDLPHGIALHGDWLYIGETGAVRRIRLSAEKGEVQGELEPVVTGLPPGGRHWTKTIGIGPDEHLYVSVGSSCNACIEEDPRRAAITRYTLDGDNEEPYATGLRNSVGFAWDPKTDVMWATDNNRDLLGDDFPPCELNRVVEGASFGWPYANGDRIPDPDFDEGFEAEIAASLPPALDLGAHTAPLGITFYDHEGEGFPEEYRDAAFVALHGSWNRSKKIGYEVVAVHADENGSLRHEPFFTGFLSEDEVSGRPVDVAVGPDGALYVSDDYAGQVYRIAWGEDRAGGVIPAAARGATGDPLAGVAAAERARAGEAGLTLWNEADCGACHGPERSEGQRPLADLGERYSIESLERFLAAPQPPMPLYPLDDEQRRDLAIYLLARY
jgi:glucose/arabinose dehydrogenase